MFGRCKRGCEGLFPVNYVEIKVPLTTKKQGPNQSIREKTNAYVPPPQVALLPEKKKQQQQQEPERKCRALYDFNAETEEDLTISVSKSDEEKEFTRERKLILLFYCRKETSSR